MTIDTVTLALPSKGALADPTLGFLADCGLRVDKPNPRQYTGVISALPSIAVLFQRVNDVLYKVADGTAQLGITGLDVVKEQPFNEVVVIHDDLHYGQCKLIVAVPESWIDVTSVIDLAEVAHDMREQHGRNLRVATKFTRLARKFLYEHGIHQFSLVNAEGAIEAAPTIGYADVIIDLTQTGTTLRENHLKPLDDGTLLESQACLIGNHAALKNSTAQRDVTRLLLEYVDAALQGKRYIQLTCNIRGESAEVIAQRIMQNPVTRGLQGPTIAPIYGSDPWWYTVTLIISNRDLLPAVDYLRAVGGVQTTVSPVRYAFMDCSPTYQMLQDVLDQ
ncbi:MAG: ATP phosphoribosyltransferase [Anaerolineae bacterium]|nr:ATP phosphoribosyltransferase [Anaerolineae bacterium]NUQ02486.1 ATP phosphoribosyltransferase [Anaerolineae bacterium]